MKLFELVATLGLKADEFSTGLDKMGKKAATGLKSVQGSLNAVTDKVQKGLMVAGTAAVGVAALLLKTGMDYNAKMENYTTNFGVMLGSTEKAVEKVEELKKMAAATPFGMEELAKATETMLSFGMDADKTQDVLNMLGDISLGNKEKLSSLSLAFAQVSSAGKLTGQDLLQMINAGFNPLQSISEKTGASIGDLKDVMAGGKGSKEFQKKLKEARKEVKKMGAGASESAKMLVQMGDEGQISAELVEQAMRDATSEGGLFFEGMEKASQTLSGRMATLQDDFAALTGKMAAPFNKAMANKVVPALIRAVEKLSGLIGGNEAGFESLAETIGDFLVGAIDKVVTVIEWTIEHWPLVSTILTGIIAGFVALKVATVALNVVMAIMSANHVTLTIIGIAAAVAALVIGIKLLVDNWDAVWGFVKEKATGVWRWITTLWGNVSDWFTENVGTPLTNFFTKLWEDIAALPQKAIDAAANLLANIWEKISGQATTAEDIKGFFSGIGDTLGAMWNSVADGAKAVLTTISGALSGDKASKEAILTFFSGLWESITGFFSGALDMGGTIVQGLYDGVAAKFTEIGDAITKTFTDWWDGILKFFGIQSPSTEAAAAGGHIVDGLQEGIEGKKESATAKIGKVFQGIWDGILSIFGGGSKTESTEAKKVGTDLMTGLEQGLNGTTAEEKATTTANQILTAFATAFNIVDGVSNASLVHGKAVVDGIGKGAEDAPFTGGGTVFTKAYNAISTAFGLLGTGIGSGMYATKFTPVGKAISEGIAKGITDNVSKITTAAENAAKAAYDAAMAALKAKSPSRLMMEVGGYFSEGFAIGIENGIAGVVDASANLMDAAAGVSRNAATTSVNMAGAAGGSLGNGGINVTQNIQTVPLSPNELAEQSAYHLGLLRFAL